MKRVMHDALNELTGPQVEFICTQMNIDQEKLFEMDEASLDLVYDKMCDIEIDETMKDEEKLSDIGKLAEGIVTVLGNAIARDEGNFDEK